MICKYYRRLEGAEGSRKGWGVLKKGLMERNPTCGVEPQLWPEFQPALPASLTSGFASTITQVDSLQ